MTEQQTANGSSTIAAAQATEPERTPPAAEPVPPAAGTKPALQTPARPVSAPWLQPLQLTIEQTAILTSYSVRTLKRLVADGAIPGVTRVGRCLRFNCRAVERWLEDGCPRPARRSGRR
jgi:excisionase family DNA binding protein